MPVLLTLGLALAPSVVVGSDDDDAGAAMIVNNSRIAVGGTVSVHAVADQGESVVWPLGAPTAGSSAEVLRIEPRDSDGFAVDAYGFADAASAFEVRYLHMRGIH